MLSKLQDFFKNKEMIPPNEVLRMIMHPPKIVEIRAATIRDMYGIYEKLPKQNSLIMPSAPKSQQPAILLYEIFVTHKITVSNGDVINVITSPQTRLTVDTKNAFCFNNLSTIHLRFFIMACIFDNFGTYKPPVLSECACGRGETCIREYNSWLISSKVASSQPDWKWTLLPRGAKRYIFVWFAPHQVGFIYDIVTLECRGVYETVHCKPEWMGHHDIVVYEVLLWPHHFTNPQVVDVLYCSGRPCCNMPFEKRLELIKVPYYDINPSKMAECPMKLLIVHKKSEYRPWIKDVLICRPSRGPDVAVLSVRSTGLCQAQAVHELPILEEVGYTERPQHLEKWECARVYYCRLVGDREWVIIKRASRKEPITLYSRYLEMPSKLCSDDYKIMFAFPSAQQKEPVKKITE